MNAKISPSSMKINSSGLLLTITLVTACGQSPVAPPAEGTTAAQALSGGEFAKAPAMQHGVALCHRTGGSNGFVPLTVGAAAVEAHFKHGDVRVGDAVPGAPGTIFTADCTSVATRPVTITFSSLTANGSAITTYSEEGFELTASRESWRVRTTYGNPQPFIYFDAGPGAAPRTGDVTVTAGGASFRFSSVDVYSSTTSIPYTFTGLLGSTVVFSVTATQPQTFGNFATVANPESGQLIDTLVISLTNAPAPCCGNPVGLDNIMLIR